MRKTDLQFSYLSRPIKSYVKKKKNTHDFYNFSINDLERNLVKGEHSKI